MTKKKREPLTWDELATLYDQRNGGRKARTLPMEQVLKWAKKQSDIEIGSEDDCLYMKAK